jgi:hypothetical protein
LLCAARALASAMIFEEQRFLHEDLERLEQAIADRLKQEPKNVSYMKIGVSDF